MTDLDILLAVAGFIATVLVVAGMILITPQGAIEGSGDGTDSQGEELHQAGAVDATDPVAQPAN